MSPILGIYASQISGHLFAPSGSYDSIATTTVGAGGVSSVSFTSIPSTYTHLQLRILGQTNRATYGIEELKMTFNGDTTTSYRNHNLYGDGSSAFASTNSTPSILLGDGMFGTSTGGTFGGGVLDILDYANTNKNTTTRLLAGVDINGTIAGYGGRVGLSSGLWPNTAAITSINIAPNNGSLITQYSSFALYGIRGN
jgi:hypothetical protein